MEKHLPPTHANQHAVERSDQRADIQSSVRVARRDADVAGSREVSEHARRRHQLQASFEVDRRRLAEPSLAREDHWGKPAIEYEPQRPGESFCPKQSAELQDPSKAQSSLFVLAG